MFYKLFLSDCCLGKQCYDKCKYKYNHSSADIRIGDLWGNTYKDNEDGVSAAVAYTAKGEEVLQKCNCELVEHPFEVVAEGQMKTCPKRSVLYDNIRKALSSPNTNITDVCYILENYRKRQRMVSRIRYPVRTIKNIIKKIIRRR